MTLGQRGLNRPLWTPPPHRPKAVTKTLRVMAKQMIEISKSKTVDNALGDYISRTRNGQAWTKEDYDWQNNKGTQGRQYGVRDWSRAFLNFEVVRKDAEGKPVVQPIDHTKPLLQERWQKRINEGYKATVKTKNGEVRKPIKKSEVKLVKMELGGNRQRMHELAFDGKVNLGKNGIGTNGHINRRADIEQWALDSYDFIAKEFGAENIIDFVVHLDETNPHVHVALVPLTRDGKLSYTELFGGSHAQAVAAAQADGTKPNFQKQMSERTKQLHTSFAREVGDKWGLERGDDIKITGNTHKSTDESLREHNKLEEEINQLAEVEKQATCSVHSLKVEEKQRSGHVDALKEAERRADESLSTKNKLLSKMGVQIVRPTTELEAENERLRHLREKAEVDARLVKENAVAAKEKAIREAKEDVRRTLPAEIRRMASFRAVEGDSVEKLAGTLNWYGKELQNTRRQVAAKESEIEQLHTTHGILMKFLMSIPPIAAAINLIRKLFAYPHTLAGALGVSQVQTINDALSLVDGVDKRKELGASLVSIVGEEYKQAAPTTTARIQSEVDEVANGTHMRMAQELEQSQGFKTHL